MNMQIAANPSKTLTRAMMVLLLGLAASNVQTLEQATQLSLQPIDRAGEWDFRQDGRGGLWLGYYDLSRALHLRDPQGQDRTLIPADKNESTSGLAMAAREDGVNLLWREKFPVKKIFLYDTSRPESPPVPLGEGSEPLPRLLADFSQGRLHLLWYGERGDPALQQKNFIYTQSYDPATAQASAIDRLAAGLYPVWARDAAGNTLVFSWLMDAEGSRVIARRRAVEAKEFDPPVTLAAVETVSQIFPALEAQGHWYVFWATSRAGEDRLEGAVSSDFGQTWRHFVLEALANIKISSLDVAADGAGRVFLALSGSEQATPGAKQDIRLIRSTDHGATWQVTRPRPEEISQRFRARNPSLEIGPGPGQVLMVWEDWRHIRPQLFISLSLDGGESWTIENLALPQPAGINRTLTDALSAVYAQGQTYHVLTQQPLDDSFAAYHLYDFGFTLTDLQHLAENTRLATDGTSSAAAKPAGTPGQASAPPVSGDKVQAASQPEERLRERVSAFWNAMANQDFDEAYELQDPFFRARNSRNGYIGQMGRISYRDINIEEVKIDGPIAKVKTRFMAGVIPFRASSTGQMITRPEQEVKLNETWLLIDGDWYHEYYSQVNEVKYTRY